MKKIITFSIIAILAAAPAVHARAVEGPDAARHARRAELIAERRAQGPAAESTRAAKPAGDSKMAKFWKNEGERSGLGDSGSRMGNFFRSLNPGPFLRNQEKRYEERKAASK